MGIRPYKWEESKWHQPGLVSRGSKGRCVSGTYSGVWCILRAKSGPGGGGKLSCGGHPRPQGMGNGLGVGEELGKVRSVGIAGIYLQSLVCKQTT